MVVMSRAKALLAGLSARRFGRPVPPEVLEEALQQEGATPKEAHEATQQLIEERAARETEGGLLPNSPPLATRAPDEVASFSRLHR